MTTVALRLPDQIIRRIEELVDSGKYVSRSEVIRAALEVLFEAEERKAIDQALREGYSRIPPTEEEIEWARAAGRAAIEAEPW